LSPISTQITSTYWYSPSSTGNLVSVLFSLTHNSTSHVYLSTSRSIKSAEVSERKDTTKFSQLRSVHSSLLPPATNTNTVIVEMNRSYFDITVPTPHNTNRKITSVASPGFVARRGKDWNYVTGTHGDFGAGCSSCSM